MWQILKDKGIEKAKRNFNEGEGDTDPQALHYGIHLLKSLPRTRKITFFFLFDKIMVI
jgi:hypothetical protein